VSPPIDPTNPFTLIAAVIWWAAVAAWWVVSTCTRNVAPLGPWWVAFYWLCVVGLWGLGREGAAHIRASRVGNDFLEFANERARWVGKVAVLFELQVRWDAFQGYAALGYPAAVALVAVGLLGLWTLALSGVWLAVKAAEIRRARNRRLARRS
jgi:hypothetical protein